MDYLAADTPDSIPALFAEAWNRRDPDKIAALFDPDAEFVNVVGLWWHDREAIRQAHAFGLERIFNESTLRVVEVRVKSLAEGIAVVHARMILTDQGMVEDVVEPMTRTTIFSFVLHRTPEGIWSCASAHNTDVVPGQQTNVIDERGELRAVDYREGSE